MTKLIEEIIEDLRGIIDFRNEKAIKRAIYRLESNELEIKSIIEHHEAEVRDLKATIKQQVQQIKNDTKEICDLVEKNEKLEIENARLIG